MLNHTYITQNTYIQSWMVMEIMAIEKCGLLGCPRTVRRPWRHTRPLRMPGNETSLANIVMQWPRRVRYKITDQLRPAWSTWKPKDKYDSSASVFVVQFNGFMSPQVTLMLSTDINITETTYSCQFQYTMYLVINKWVTAVKFSNFSGHYLRNRSTLDIGVLGYIGIV